MNRIIVTAALLVAPLMLNTASADAYLQAPPPKAKEADKAARKAVEQREIRAAVTRGELVPLPRILAIANKRVPGDVLKVELERETWGLKYEIKILTSNGRVREVELDARTGAIIAIKDD